MPDTAPVAPIRPLDEPDLFGNLSDERGQHALDLFPPEPAVKRGIDLAAGDVIVGPSGTRHAVTATAHLPGNAVTVHTDTGIHLALRWDDARHATYNVAR